MTTHCWNSQIAPYSHATLKQPGKQMRILMGIPKIRGAGNAEQAIMLGSQLRANIVSPYPALHPPLAEFLDRMKFTGRTDQSRNAGGRQHGASLS
jgi:hypothetical protein